MVLRVLLSVARMSVVMHSTPTQRPHTTLRLLFWSSVLQPCPSDLFAPCSMRGGPFFCQISATSDLLRIKNCSVSYSSSHALVKTSKPCKGTIRAHKFAEFVPLSKISQVCTETDVRHPLSCHGLYELGLRSSSQSLVQPRHLNLLIPQRELCPASLIFSCGSSLCYV